MAFNSSASSGNDGFKRIHPVTKMIIAVALGLIAFFLLRREDRNTLVVSMCAWCIFALTYLIFSWVTIFSRSIESIKTVARVNDGSRLFVAALIFMSSVASLVFVLLLLVNHDTQHEPMIIFPICMAAIILSWILIHTTLVFHYAHIYYDDDPAGVKTEQGGLDFPGDSDPDYLDFAYYSFVIGMTFQVSDVQITSRKFRKLALLHGLIAFGLNTFVVALTINLVAGLSH